jgi:Protein of unknown function (DUF1353)
MAVPLVYFKNKWRVVDNLQVSVRGHDILIQEGFRTDLASIPRILWWVLPPFGDYNEAAVVHDFLYRKLHKKSEITRKEADLIFLVLMERANVHKIIRYTFYVSVRTFGWIAYGKNDR